MSAVELLERGFWEGRHGVDARRPIYPDPERIFLDYALHQVFCRHLPGAHGQRMMEFGCGSSIWLPYFAREWGLRLAGVDYSEPGLERSREILQRHDVKAELLACDLFGPPPEGLEPCDLAFSLGLVEHFDPPCRVLERMAGMLAPGGRMFTWAPNTSGRIARSTERLCRNLPRFYVPMDLNGLADQHRLAGLEVIESRYLQFLDLTLLFATSLSPRSRRALGALCRLASRVALAAERRRAQPRQSASWCAGMIVVARKPAGPAKV
jgi:SAM-dependent methyltransferase